MAASPVSPTTGDDTSLPASLAEWLRDLDDRKLVRLLRLRPDLALPTPADFAALANRAAVRTSTQRAVDSLDAPALAALEALVLAADDDDTIGGRAGAGGVQARAIDGLDEAAVAELLDRALVWGGGGRDGRLALTPTVREAVGPYPAGLGRPAAALFARMPDVALVPVLRRLGEPPTSQPRAGQIVADVLADPQRLADLIASTDPDERDVLARLAAGPPVGTVRSTRVPAGPDQSPANRLIGRGLLAVIDQQRVELPREVGLALRRDGGTDTGPTSTPPEPKVVAREPDELDRLGTTAVRETLRLVDSLADTWSAQAPAVLRSGGVGVRELRRTARDLGVEESTAALVAEVAFAAGLINSTNGPEPVFLPSTEYDAWHQREIAARWITLASAWLSMTRQPSLVNQRGERDRVISVLGPDVERGTIPALRRQVLELLAGLRPGEAPADRTAVLELLAWQQPRRASSQRQLVESILGEADQLGITAAGGLTGYTRTLLAGSAGDVDSRRFSGAAADALARALPDLVDHFLVQPDLTVVVPGPPLPELGSELALLANVESTGGASVYRITERSVRRALDAGRTAEQLTTFVSTHSRTPVPQALQYMIDDGARRHGQLRTGTASAYIRCDDESLLAHVLTDRATAELGLRLLAPTVLIAQAPVNRVLEALRSAGFAPAAESPAGDLITIDADRPRAPSRPPARPIVSRAHTDSDAHTAELVRRIRSGDAAGLREQRVQSVVAQVPGVTSASTMEVLRTAIREGRLVWVGVAQPDGAATAHELYPISLAAGAVRGYERGDSKLTSFPVHRLTNVRIVDEDDE